MAHTRRSTANSQKMINWSLTDFSDLVLSLIVFTCWCLFRLSPEPASRVKVVHTTCCSFTVGGEPVLYRFICIASLLSHNVTVLCECKYSIVWKRALVIFCLFFCLQTPPREASVSSLFRLHRANLRRVILAAGRREVSGYDAEKKRLVHVRFLLITLCSSNANVLSFFSAFLPS